MAKRQSRRSISVRGATYNQLREHCGGASISMSEFIEQRIAEFFADHPAAARAAAHATRAPHRPEAPRLVEPIANRRPTAVAPPARVAPLPAVAPRPVPATSTMVSRAAPIASRRAVSTVTPIAWAPRAGSDQGGAVGRPAPTPAAAVLKERLTPATPRDAKDYRAIRF